MLSIQPIRIFLLQLLFVAATACSGSGNNQSTNDAGIADNDAGGTDDTASCSFDNCPTGCCRDGTCIDPGDSVDACGTSGMACATCEGAEACFGGQCAEPTNDCEDCQGCCLDGTQCVEGNSAQACGTGGEACVSCNAGEGCINDVCEVKVCDETNCADGCCTANGDCVPYGLQDVDTCGDEASLCASCAAGAFDCVQGQCIDDQPCLSYCTDGCCTAQGQCILFEDQKPNECGAAEQCMACADGLACVTGECTADAVWSIKVKSAVVEPTKTDGSKWDAVGNELPDVFVAGALGDAIAAAGFTETIHNTLTPNWDQIVFTRKGSDIINQGLFFEFRDFDFAFIYDFMAGCFLNPTAADLAAGSMIDSNGCGSIVEYTIEFEQQ